MSWKIRVGKFMARRLIRQKGRRSKENETALNFFAKSSFRGAKMKKTRKSSAVIFIGGIR
jgi:hypothetical protein